MGMTPLDAAWRVLKGTAGAAARGGHYPIHGEEWRGDAPKDVTQIDPNIVSMWLRHKFPGRGDIEALDPAGEDAQRMARQAFQAHPTPKPDYLSPDSEARDDEAREKHEDLKRERVRFGLPVPAFRDYGGMATGIYEPRDPNLDFDLAEGERGSISSRGRKMSSLDHQGYDVHYADDRDPIQGVPEGGPPQGRYPPGYRGLGELFG